MRSQVKFPSDFDRKIKNQIAKQNAKNWELQLTTLAKREIFDGPWSRIYWTGDTHKATRAKHHGDLLFDVSAPGINYVNKIYFGLGNHQKKGPRPWLRTSTLKFIEYLKNAF